MHRFEPEARGFNITLLGDFNPKILQPAWLAAHELIRNQEAEGAKIDIIHEEVVDFHLDWVRLQVTRERFSVFTTQVPYQEPLVDLVLGIFKLLSHTPVRKMGINNELHFKLESEKEWHDFGHKLAPKEIWENLLEKPGTRSLTIQGVRPDKNLGYIRVKIEPSQGIQFGVYFHVNDHYDAQIPPNGIINTTEIASILEKSWRQSIERSEKIVYSLLERK